MTRKVVLLLLSALVLNAAAGVAPLSAAAPTATSAAGPATPKLDINLADREQLLAVPGIGPHLADAILELRASKGAFSKLEELLEIRGIGDKSLQHLAERLVVAAQAPAAQAAAVQPGKK